MTQEVKVFKLYDQSVLAPLDLYTPGIETFDFKVFSGSRILTTLFVKSIDPGASVSIEVLNSFSVDSVATWDSILSFSSNTLGHTKRIITDFNKFFQYRITVAGGSVEFAIAISVFDNSDSVPLENDSSGLIVDNASPTIIYIGEGTYGASTSEPKWLIKRIDLAGGVVIKAASKTFDQIWDNRASLTYV
jgi:hypothetical protein